MVVGAGVDVVVGGTGVVVYSEIGKSVIGNSVEVLLDAHFAKYIFQSTRGYVFHTF